MKKLPTEIVVEITSYLSLLYKLNLACACKELYTAISENSLYNKLVFNDEDKFNQAMDLYDKLHLGQQVRELSIGNMDYDAQLVTALPTLFPRVRFLNLQQGSGGGFNGINTHLSKIIMAKNWENVQSIVDASNIMNVTMQLLQLLTFDHLTSLVLDCERCDPSTNGRKDRTQTLIQSIHNAPLLENLVFRYPLLKIGDVEILLAGATRLKHLQFMDVHIYAEGEESHATYHPNESLESFSFRNTTEPLELIRHGRTVGDSQAIRNAVRDWILYVGIKYPHLQNLDLILNLSWTGENTTDRQLTTTSLTTALANLKHLKSYSVDLCYDPQPIVDVMGSNDVQLKNFGFLVESQLSLEHISTAIGQTAQPLSYISSLEINCAARANSLSLSDPLIDLCRSGLENLTSLTVKCHSRNGAIFLIDVVQNLTMLESLVFGAFRIDDDMDDGIFYNKVSNIHTTGRLESICLSGFVVEDDEDCLKKLNLLLAFILRSCSNLKNCELIAKQIDACGKINLDFRQHPLLQQITLHMPECQYYTFQHEFGKHWRNIKEEINKYDFAMNFFFVNLAWDLTKDIKVELSGSRSS